MFLSSSFPYRLRLVRSQSSTRSLPDWSQETYNPTRIRSPIHVPTHISSRKPPISGLCPEKKKKWDVASKETTSRCLPVLFPDETTPKRTTPSVWLPTVPQLAGLASGPQD